MPPGYPRSYRHVDDEPPSAYAGVDDHRPPDGDAQWTPPWWGRASSRLILLLAVLAIVAAFGAHRLLETASGHASASCIPTSSHPPPRWSVAKVKHMVAITGLASLIGDGSLDMQGPQDPMAAWSDQYPSYTSFRDPFLVPALAGYEIRWWSRQDVHEVADLFVFQSAGAAARYVRQAVSLGCRHFGAVAYRIAEPSGARSVIWDNPLGYLQADVFFARGTRAYRISVVPPGPANQAPGDVDGPQLLAAPMRIACRLGDARCGTPGGRGGNAIVVG